MITQTLADAWQIYRRRFGLIAAVVLTIWVPCNLVDSYCTYFVIDPDNFRASFRLSQFLENFFGIIATAGVTYVVLNHDADPEVRYGESIGVGLRTWGRMWVTRFLFSVSLIIGLLLLVVPGVYFATRFLFAETVVVAEGLSATRALQRSFDLTRGRFWPVFGLIVLAYLPVVVLIALMIAAVVFIPVLDHWLVDAAFMMVCDVLAAFVTVVFTCGYQRLAAAPDADL